MVEERSSSVPNYVWYEMTFYTHVASDRTLMLCLDTPDELRLRLEIALSGSKQGLDLSDPFALHVPLIDEVVVLNDRSVWQVRDLIRTIEKVQ